MEQVAGILISPPVFRYAVVRRGLCTCKTETVVGANSDREYGFLFSHLRREMKISLFYQGYARIRKSFILYQS